MQNNITLSSRVRLARNIDGLQFPSRMSRQDLDTVCAKAADVFGGADFDIVPIEGLTRAQRLAYIEKHLASRDLMESGVGMLVLSRDETISVMVGEEDHFRIQCILPGSELQRSTTTALGVDDMLEKQVDFAFDEALGYLTACPTNIGTGMRASIMVHLPALTMTGQMGRLQKSLRDAGMTVRGIYGEGTNALGSIYQISNRVTLGATEEQLSDAVSQSVQEMVGLETEARTLFQQSPPNSVEDNVYRAKALLANARSMGHGEFMKYWSDAMLGAGLGWIELDTDAMVSLLQAAQPGVLTLGHGAQGKETEIARAEICRATVK